ncbi:MAG: hypothetical protein Q4F29_01730, partial [Lachnospiraceae bacterium]|nr:hypothetical protein [Lachnospiraceae bacterium]
PGMTRMIADYTHSFFQKPLPGIPTLYSCRKFFGVADGSYVSASGCDALAAGRYQNLPVDVSYDRMHFLLGRFEAPASEFYQEYAENNEIFTTEPVKQMSKLTHNLLRGIDYEFVKEQRSANFAFLHRHLKKWNRLDLPDITGAYAYPFWPKEGLPEGHLLRRPLISQKIYVPTLWPEVLSLCTEDSPECPMAADILPLPVDQRYGEPDMMEILKILESLLPG